MRAVFVQIAQLPPFLLQKLCASCHQKNPKKYLTFATDCDIIDTSKVKGRGTLPQEKKLKKFSKTP